MRRLYSLGLTAAVVAIACTNAGEKLALPPLAEGSLSVGVYFDRDGSRTLTNGDTTFTGVRIALLIPGGADTVRTATTNAQGVALFDSLPIGSYRVVVDTHALGDSVGVVAGDTGAVRLIAQADSIQPSRLIRLGYAEYSLAQARVLAAGHRILVRGKVTVPLQIFRDTSTFIVDTSGSLRITDARTQPGHGGNAPGDSVLVLGTTGTVLGQGVLQNGLIITIGAGISPTPTTATVADARVAKSDTLDAALVRISGVVIKDTAAVSSDFTVKIADPVDTSITMTAVIDPQLGAPHSIFRIGHTMTITGVLVPVGDGTWVIKPRGANDLVIN